MLRTDQNQYYIPLPLAIIEQVYYHAYRWPDGQVAHPKLEQALQINARMLAPSEVLLMGLWRKHNSDAAREGEIPPGKSFFSDIANFYEPTVLEQIKAQPTTIELMHHLYDARKKFKGERSQNFYNTLIAHHRPIALKDIKTQPITPELMKQVLENIKESTDEPERSFWNTVFDQQRERVLQQYIEMPTSWDLISELYNAKFDLNTLQATQFYQAAIRHHQPILLDTEKQKPSNFETLDPFYRRKAMLEEGPARWGADAEVAQKMRERDAAELALIQSVIDYHQPKAMEECRQAPSTVYLLGNLYRYLERNSEKAKAILQPLIEHHEAILLSEWQGNGDSVRTVRDVFVHRNPYIPQGMTMFYDKVLAFHRQKLLAELQQPGGAELQAQLRTKAKHNIKEEEGQFFDDLLLEHAFQANLY